MPDELRRERWTHRELAERVGMSESQAHEILCAAEIKPHLLDQWVVSELGPDFAEGMLIVSIDEKPGIQAKTATQPDAPARPAKPDGREYEYTRNGTQNLFAARQVHAGTVSAMPAKSRNRFDLLRFLDQLEAEISSGRQPIAISDNLSTRTTREVTDWLADRSRRRFVFTPEHASWLNQVEIFFSILARRLLKRGAFTGENDLAQQMLAFVETYNQTARPFNWTCAGTLLTV